MHFHYKSFTSFQRETFHEYVAYAKSSITFYSREYGYYISNYIVCMRV